MLSIALVASSAQARHYYRKDDYYLSGTESSGSSSDEARGEWYGRGSRALGLTGGATPEAFVALLDGSAPDGQSLRAERQDKRHTPGWDLTFSAPKSVSILAEVGGDERLFEAHSAAVKEALDWVEKHAIGLRQRSAMGRLFRRTESMVATLFVHHTSRNQDPDLHTHSVVSNVTQKRSDEWAAVHSKILFEHKMAAGVVYRAALARRVLELGYQIDTTRRDGLFEVRDVPGDLMRAMSTRREQIESALERWGREDAESAARATLMTRQRKKSADRNELVERWRAAIAARGWDLDETVHNARDAGSQKANPGIDVPTALKDAVDRLSEPEAVFSHRELVRYGLAATVGRASVKDIEAEIMRAERDGWLHRADEAGIEKWTTPRAKEQERRMIEAMLEGQGTHRAIATPERARDALVSRALNEEQRNAAEAILTSTDQFMQVRGLPGTGKTTRVLKTVREIAEDRGTMLVGMAQNANAARNLEIEAGISSVTVHKHLNTLGRDIAALRNAHPLRAMLIRFPYRKQVWIVDEGAQLPNSLKRRLIFAAERLGTKVVSVGDPGQFGAIEAGKPFQLLMDKGVQQASLVQMQRTRDPQHRAALIDAQAGRIGKALERLASVTQVVEDRKPRLEAMLEAYRGLGPERQNTLLLTARNAEKRVLNEGVRDILKEEGQISGAMPRKQLVKVFSRRADRRDASFFEEGWIVRFSRDYESLGVHRNDYREVVSVDPDQNIVMLRAHGDPTSPAIEWNPRLIGSSNRHATELFKLVDTELAPGEPVRWARNSPTKGGPINGQILKVVNVTPHETTFATDKNELISIDHRDLDGRHWDHAYASTIYSAQGKTASTALVNAESDVGELFSQKAFNVALSRHVHEIRIFTDDLEKLRKSLLTHAGEKTSAVEALERAAQAQSILKDSERSDGERGLLPSTQTQARADRARD